MGLTMRAVAVVLAFMLAACTGADLTAPAAPCSNALRPPTFRLVLSSGDTLPRRVNRYLEPHRNSETFRVRLDRYSTLVLPVTYAPGYCITALDSAAWTTNHTSGVVE